MFDPKDSGSNNPQNFFDDMSKVVNREVEGFSYYSVPFGFKKDRIFYSLYQTARAWLGSWVRGYLHPYRYAWVLAENAGLALAKKLEKEPEPVDILCHSLGSRVVIVALKYVPEKINKVVFFNGAELVRNTESVDGNFLNLAVLSDNVLKFLGKRFSGDKNGETVGQYGVPGWNNIFLDDANEQAFFKERFNWDIQGDNPNSYWDHWYSYRFTGNHTLVRAFLEDNYLDFKK